MHTHKIFNFRQMIHLKIEVTQVLTQHFQTNKKIFGVNIIDIQFFFNKTDRRKNAFWKYFWM